jgi:HPt (histidine-containing phosphotransfer) domain-containing protein
VIKGAKERGLLSGFDSFLGKPIVLKELERVFLTYLKVSSADSKFEESDTAELAGIIKGLDTDKLAKELMLNSDELLMLLTLFIKKMATSLDDLQNAIKHRDYKKIALCAHAIKGSSGNFRIESLQDASSEMEKMAKNENSKYNYEKVYIEIKNRVEQIEIL